MKIEAVLFDLDGTLLPMDQAEFTKAYFGGLAKKLSVHGYDSKKLIDSIWAGSEAMVKNDGRATNEAVFWKKFSEIYGADVKKDERYFEEYYREEFDKVKDVCGFNPDSVRAVSLIKSMGIRTALATNPLFPSIATEKRLAWAGFKVTDFEIVTTYENSYYCKPSLSYYKQILSDMGLSAERTLMVGNDVSEDMVAEKLGMKVFLINECLINRKNADISIYPQGDFQKLIEYINVLNQ